MYYSKGNKPDTERQILYGLPYYTHRSREENRGCQGVEVRKVRPYWPMCMKFH